MRADRGRRGRGLQDPRFLCWDVRQNGGFVLAVGNAMDVWQGKSARCYQDEAFIAKHKIQ